VVIKEVAAAAKDQQLRKSIRVICDCIYFVYLFSRVFSIECLLCLKIVNFTICVLHLTLISFLF
jgi:hypothetical protein